MGKCQAHVSSERSFVLWCIFPGHVMEELRGQSQKFPLRISSRLRFLLSVKNHFTFSEREWIFCFSCFRRIQDRKTTWARFSEKITGRYCGPLAPWTRCCFTVRCPVEAEHLAMCRTVLPACMPTPRSCPPAPSCLSHAAPTGHNDIWAKTSISD